MNTPNVHAGRLERWVRLVGNGTMPGGIAFALILTPQNERKVNENEC